MAPDLSERARSAILRTLTDLGVDIVTESRVTRIDGSSCELAGGARVEADCTILATEFGVPDLARRSGLPVDGLGRLKVDDRLECSSHPNIVGAGDAVAVGDLLLRMSCQAAIPLGVHAAETILHRLEGSAPRPVAPKFAGRCISLGRRRGVIQRTTRVDDATGMFVAGRAGAFVKERVCSSTTDWALTPRRSFFYSWTCGALVTLDHRLDR